MIKSASTEEKRSAVLELEALFFDSSVLKTRMSVKTFGLNSLLLEIIICLMPCHSDEFSDI